MNKVFIILISLALLCGSCATSEDFYLNRDKLISLRVGMSKQQITKLYGNPHYRNIERDYEIWKYKYYTANRSGYDFLEIKFVGEFAESIDSYFLPDSYPVPANKSSSENVTTQ